MREIEVTSAIRAFKKEIDMMRRAGRINALALDAVKNLIEPGITTQARFDRVHAPIGLDIGAVTASEIAASIVAQLIEVRRKGPVS